MVSRNIRHLRAHGPSSREELPNQEVSAEDRRNGVWKIHVSPGLNPQSRGGARNTRAVYYLEGDHTKEEALEKWLDVNDHWLEREGAKAVRTRLRNLGRNWHDAIDDVLPI